jgi:hypothetical protein
LNVSSIVLAAVVAAALSAWWWFVHCEYRCATADHDSDALYQRGELWSALALIDSTDAGCRCARFTSGDMPPQYAVAQACIRALRQEGRGADVDRLLARTRSSILQELAKQ